MANIYIVCCYFWFCYNIIYQNSIILEGLSQSLTRGKREGTAWKRSHNRWHWCLRKHLLTIYINININDTMRTYHWSLTAAAADRRCLTQNQLMTSVFNLNIDIITNININDTCHISLGPSRRHYRHRRS